MEKKQVFLQSFNTPECVVGLLMVVGKKQPSEMFCKKGVLKKFLKFHRKIAVLESLFNKVAGLRPATLLKRDSNTAVFL